MYSIIALIEREALPWLPSCLFSLFELIPQSLKSNCVLLREWVIWDTVVTLTRAEISCSSAKILHAESGLQYRESPALLSFAWLGWLCSVPTQVEGFLPRAGWFPGHWDSVCWSCGWFTEARGIQPHELGFLLPERDSRKSYHCYWDCHEKEQRALARWNWTRQRNWRGQRKTLGIWDPWQLELNPQIHLLQLLPSFLLILNQHVAGAILLRDLSQKALPNQSPDDILFFKLLWEFLQMSPHNQLWEGILMIVRWNAGPPRWDGSTPDLLGPPSGWKHPRSPVLWGHQILALEREFGGYPVSFLFPSGTLSSGSVGREIFSRSSELRCHKAEWLLLFEKLIPLFLRLFRFHLSKVRRPA